MLVKETDIVSSPCPLRDEDESIYYTIAYSVLKKGILKSFEGNPLSINKIRDAYVQLWDDHWVSTYGETAKEPTGLYWAGPRMAITIANKIISFLNKYEIIVPIQPYSYTLDTYIVEGTNCIVRSKVGRVRPWLSVNVVSTQLTKQGLPGLAFLTRWYNTHLTNQQPQTTGFLILPLSKGSIKTLIIKNIPKAREWILQGLKRQNLLFPIIGQHCETCKSKKCTEVLDVGQDEDRRVGWLRQISISR
jgi:hypothetical protein